MKYASRNILYYNINWYLFILNPVKSKGVNCLHLAMLSRCNLHFKFRPELQIIRMSENENVGYTWSGYGIGHFEM